MGVAGGRMTTPLSGPMLRETRAALDILRRHWPRQFAFAASASEDAAQTVQDYGRALLGCDMRLIVPAAQRWVAEEKFGPKPAELASLVRSMSRAASAPAPTDQPRRSAYHRARPIWLARPGAPDGYGRLDAEHAIAFTLETGGTLNLSEIEMDKIHGHEIAWGWLTPADVPHTAAPAEFFVSWELPTREGAA